MADNADYRDTPQNTNKNAPASAHFTSTTNQSSNQAMQTVAVEKIATQQTANRVPATKTSHNDTSKNKNRLAQKQKAIIRQKLHSIPLTMRLLLAITLLLIAGLGITAITVIGILQSNLLAQVDRELVLTSSKLANNYNTDIEKLLATKTHILPEQAGNYFIRYNVRNNVIKIPSTLTKQYGLPNEADMHKLEVISTTRFSAPVTLSSDTGGTSWRALAVSMNLDGGGRVIITVATPLARINNTINNVFLYIIVSSVIFIMIGAGVAYYLVNISLKPLKKIQKVANKIADGDLSERVSIDEAPTTEVGALARSINIMLAHIEKSFEVQKDSEEKIRSFVSDASHELRTPTAAIRGYCELYRLGGIPEENLPEVMTRMESEAKRMGCLVEDMLKLARFDEGQKLHVEQVDLVKLAQDGAMDLRAMSPKRQVKVLWLTDGQNSEPIGAHSLLIKGNRNNLTQVLSNLIINVVRYTDAKVPVEILVGTVNTSYGHYALLQLRDHGNGISETEHAMIFERFYRTESSRSRSTGGTGLGLPIVLAIAKAHGGIARSFTTNGGGLTIELILPLCEDVA